MPVTIFFRLGLLLFITAFFGLPQIRAQRNNIIPPPSHIKTIEFKPLDPDSYAPVVKLGEKLKLSFDDINKLGRNVVGVCKAVSYKENFYSIVRLIIDNYFFKRRG